MHHMNIIYFWVILLNKILKDVEELCIFYNVKKLPIILTHKNAKVCVKTVSNFQKLFLKK